MSSIIEMTNQSTKYILPLEAIDLTYLPVFRRGDQTVPLWRRETDDTYFEFEVLRSNRESESIQDVNSKEDIEERINLSTYIKFITSITDNRTLSFTLKAIDEQTIEIKFKNNQKVYVPVNNFHGYYDVGEKTLCRLCRTSTKQKEMHKLNQKHMEIVMVPLHDVQCIRQIDQLWSHCILCNEVIENKEFHITCSTGHDLRLRDALGTNNIHTKDTIQTNNHTTLKNNNLVLSYNTKIAKDAHETAVTQKNKSSELLTQIKKSVTTNKIESATTSSQNKGIVYCDVCDIKMQAKNLRSHLHSKLHNERKTNKETVKSNKENIKNCMKSSKESVTANKTVEYPTTSQNSKLIVCCGVETHVNNFHIHLNGKYHKQQIKFFAESKQNAKKSDILTQNKNIILTNKKESQPISKTKETNIVTCNICGIKLHINNVSSHLNGKSHKEKEISTKSETSQPKSDCRAPQHQSKAEKQTDERIRMLVANAKNSKDGAISHQNIKPLKENVNTVPKPFVTTTMLGRNIHAETKTIGESSRDKILKAIQNSCKPIEDQNTGPSGLQFFKMSEENHARKISHNVLGEFVHKQSKNEEQVEDECVVKENASKTEEPKVNKSETEKDVNEKIKNLVTKERKKMLPKRNQQESQTKMEEKNIPVSKNKGSDVVHTTKINENIQYLLKLQEENKNKTKAIQNQVYQQLEKEKCDPIAMPQKLILKAVTVDEKFHKSACEEKFQDLIQPRVKIEKEKYSNETYHEIVIETFIPKSNNTYQTFTQQAKTEGDENIKDLVQPQAEMENDGNPTEDHQDLVQQELGLKQENIVSGDNLHDFVQPQVEIEEDTIRNENSQDYPQHQVQQEKPSNANDQDSIPPQQLGGRQNNTAYDEIVQHFVQPQAKMQKENLQDKKDSETSSSKENTQAMAQQAGTKKEKDIFKRIRSLIAKARGKNKKTADK